MPYSFAAARSIDAFLGAFDAISLRFGSCSMIERGNGVRSRMTLITSKGFSRSTSAAGSET
jgi:hypothetical protein